jgi:hypothetical protein
MNNPPKKNAKRLLIIALIVLFFWLLADRGLKLKRVVTSAEAYQNRSAALEPADPARLAALTAYLDTLRTNLPTLQSPDSAGSGESGGAEDPREASDSTEAGPETGVAAVRELLRAAGIRGERLRFSGKEGDESAELALRCEAVKFFSFLAKLSQRKHNPVNYLSIRSLPDSPEADITMRFQYE